MLLFLLWSFLPFTYQTCNHPYIHCFHVGDSWKRSAYSRGLSDHGQHSEKTCVSCLSITNMCIKTTKRPSRRELVRRWIEKYFCSQLNNTTAAIQGDPRQLMDTEDVDANCCMLKVSGSFHSVNNSVTLILSTGWLL